MAGTREKDVNAKKDLNLTFSSLCLADYTEELRFYLIHMTEVRGRIVRVVEKGKKKRDKEGKLGSNVNSYFVCEPEGA